MRLAKAGKVKRFLTEIGHRTMLGTWHVFARPSKKKLLGILRERISGAGSVDDLQALKERVFELRKVKGFPGVALEELYRAMEENPLHTKLPHPELGVRAHAFSTLTKPKPEGKIILFRGRRQK